MRFLRYVAYPASILYEGLCERKCMSRIEAVKKFFGSYRPVENVEIVNFKKTDPKRV